MSVASYKTRGVGGPTHTFRCFGMKRHSSSLEMTTSKSRRNGGNSGASQHSSNDIVEQINPLIEKNSSSIEMFYVIKCEDTSKMLGRLPITMPDHIR